MNVLVQAQKKAQSQTKKVLRYPNKADILIAIYQNM